jgi:hypothetical protein
MAFFSANFPIGSTYVQECLGMAAPMLRPIYFLSTVWILRAGTEYPYRRYTGAIA